MTLTLSSLSDLVGHPFDCVIDVRSPAEYAEDHLPGAINLPALSDAERATVGTIYKQESPFRARKIGAAMVARNVAAHLDGPLRDRGGGWRPLVYCWRGGQRSGSVAAILNAVGWRAEVVAGGYRSFRRLVVGALYETSLAHRLVLIDGFTGTGKSDLLRLLADGGAQVLDLERLANHRGSLLGDEPGGQPSQKAFETAIAMALAGFDTVRPVIVEAESSRIGRLTLPPALWQAMCASPRLELRASVEARAAYLAHSYAALGDDIDALTGRLDALRRLRGNETVETWQSLAKGGQGTALAQALITTHYDPTYARSRARHAAEPLAVIDMGDLSAAAFEAAAVAVTRHL